jgi:hypothetical protein
VGTAAIVFRRTAREFPFVKVVNARGWRAKRVIPAAYPYPWESQRGAYRARYEAQRATEVRAIDGEYSALLGPAAVHVHSFEIDSARHCLRRALPRRLLISVFRTIPQFAGRINWRDNGTFGLPLTDTIVSRGTGDLARGMTR